MRPDGSGDVTDSHIAFKLTHGVPHSPSPLLVDKRLYMISDQGVLTCADALAGKELWRQRLGGNYSASPTLADGKIYCLAEDATMHVLAQRRKVRGAGQRTIWKAARWPRPRLSTARSICAPTRICIGLRAPKAPRREVPASVTTSRRESGKFLR